MLVHLDKNKLVLRRTRDRELFDLILAVAMHSIALTPVPRRRVRVDRPGAATADDEVRAIKRWLEERAERIRRGERQVTYRQLRSILDEQGYALENPKGNYIDLIKIEEVKKGLFKKRTERRKTHIGKIGYPGDGEFVPLKELKHARRLCRLTEECGVDSDSFYEHVDVVDSFINKYRTVLRRLATK
jgi:death-on-curing protein